MIFATYSKTRSRTTFCYILLYNSIAFMKKNIEIDKAFINKFFNGEKSIGLIDNVHLNILHENSSEI